MDAQGNISAAEPDGIALAATVATDGTLSVTREDGTVTTIAPDSTVTRLEADGTTKIEVRAADGTRTEYAAAGSSTL